MIKLLYTAIVILAIAAPLGAADITVPDQKIEGGGEVAAGEVVVLSVSKLEKPENLQEVIYNWTVIEDGKVKTKGIKEWPDKSSVVFGAGVPKKDRTYTAILNINYVYVVKDKDVIKEVVTRVRQATTEVTVKGASPTPSPGPDPPPDPDPNPGPALPDGKYKLAKFTYDAANSKVTSPRRTVAQALAASYNGIASKAAAGTISSVEQLLKETTASNDRAVGSDASKWQAWSTEMQKKTYALYKNKEMVSVSDFADAWKEIAKGLESVKDAASVRGKK